MSLVLYRKYRPQTFSEVVGQEHIVKTLRNSVVSGIISHAYLFSGPRGSGKTTIARLFAKSVNCQNRSKSQEYEPCNKCSSCLEIMGGNSLDLIEIDAASHRGIEEMKELREGVRFSPVKEKYKVFILDEAHQLSRDAANALLKTLEEPPAHAIFILATTEAHKMIPTIISRCQHFDFRKLALPEIVSRLELIAGKEKARINKSALELIAINSGGAVRDAESLLGQVFSFGADFKSGNEITADSIRELLGIADTAAISRFVDLISHKNAAGAVEFLNKAIERGADPQEFAKSLVNYLRQALIVKISPALLNPVVSGLTPEEQNNLQGQSSRFSQEELRFAVNSFLEAENRMKYSSIPQLPLELAIVDIVKPKEGE